MVLAVRKSGSIQRALITPSVSLIIPTFNEEATITQKLNNIKELDYPKNMMEILVVDSASTDNTRKHVKAFIAEKINELKISLIEQEKRKGKACALNEAWALCHGEILVLSDADSLLEQDSLRQVVSNFANPSVGAVTGRQILINPKQSAATHMERGYRDLFEILRIGESQLDSTPIFHGELVAFRRSLNEDLSSDSVADDTELAIRIRKKGYRAIYDPNAKFYEYAPPTLKARVKQKQRRGMGLIQQFVRFRNLMFNRAFGKYGFLILPGEFFMHVVSPLMLATLVVLFIYIIITNPLYILLVAFFSVSFLIVASGILMVSKLVSPTNRIPNPLAVMLAFLHSQMCLLLSFFLIATKKRSHQWEKIEDIRSLWKAST